jgi:uncharacterized protein GlcG (DUF336 family)
MTSILLGALLAVQARQPALVAAVSVSGPNGPAADEACAKAGLDKIVDRLK